MESKESNLCDYHTNGNVAHNKIEPRNLLLVNTSTGFT